MPLPTPSGDEDEDTFVSRAMSDEAMKSEFPDRKQRLAVAYSQYKKQGKTASLFRYETLERHLRRAVGRNTLRQKLAELASGDD